MLVCRHNDISFVVNLPIFIKIVRKIPKYVFIPTEGTYLVLVLVWKNAATELETEAPVRRVVMH